MTLKTPPRSKGRSISCPAGPSQPHHFQGRNLHVSTTGTECGPRPDRFLSLRRQTQNLPQPGPPLALRFPALVLVSWGSCNYGPRLKTADTTDLKVLEARTWNSGHPQGRARSAGSEEGGLPASSSSWGRPACGCTPPISAISRGLCLRKVPLLSETPVTGWGPTLLQHDHMVTPKLCNDAISK